MIPALPPKQLMAMGFSFVCAHCDRLRQGTRGGVHCDVALKGKECGGPLIGMAFPHYMGFLTKSKIADLCFRCGENATKLVGVKGDGFVGVCDKHIDMLKPGAMVPVTPKRAKTA